MSKHNFPGNWWKPELGVRFITCGGDLWDCQRQVVVVSTGYPVELGDVN